MGERTYGNAWTLPCSTWALSACQDRVEREQERGARAEGVGRISDVFSWVCGQGLGFAVCGLDLDLDSHLVLDLDLDFVPSARA